MPGLQVAVFRQIAAGLPHDPDRRAFERAAGAGGEKAFAGGHPKFSHSDTEDTEPNGIRTMEACFSVTSVPPWFNFICLDVSPGE